MKTPAIHRYSGILAALLLVSLAAPAHADWYVSIDDIDGETDFLSYEEKGYFVADSFSFGVRRELDESPTASLSVPMSDAAIEMLRHAVEGIDLGTVVVDIEVGDPVLTGGAELVSHRYLRLERCYIKSWSISGDADDAPVVEFVLGFDTIDLD